MPDQTTTALQRILLPYLFSREEVQIPEKYADRVLAVKGLLESDCSGLLNSILDYAIDCASSVDFTVETPNPNLSEILNNWVKDININLVGKIPTGINALSKQYFYERWKGSSFIILRTRWEKIDGLLLLTNFWFVDGKDIIIKESRTDVKILGNEQYQLRLGKNKVVDLPFETEDQMIFVQKPFEQWSADYPTPFVIQRGLYKNAKSFELLAKKGDSIVAKAIEYMLLMKKGSADLTKLNNPDYTYSDEDLKKAIANLNKMLQEKNLLGGSATYATNFDTEMEHLIPEYGKILLPDNFTRFEKSILSGMGIIPISGIAGSRQETMLNPKPFQAQVISGVEDFKALVTDIIKVILIKNKERKKYANADIDFRKSPIKQFLDKTAYEMIRGFYDRGALSKRTAVELGVNVDYDTEVDRRSTEKKAGHEETMYPHPVQYTDKSVDIQEKLGVEGLKQSAKKNSNTTSDKKGAEKKNYTKAEKDEDTEE